MWALEITKSQSYKHFIVRQSYMGFLHKTMKFSNLYARKSHYSRSRNLQ